METTTTKTKTTKTTVKLSEPQKNALGMLTSEWGTTKIHPGVVKALSEQKLIAVKETKKDGKMLKLSAKGMKALQTN